MEVMLRLLQQFRIISFAPLPVFKPVRDGLVSYAGESGDGKRRYSSAWTISGFERCLQFLGPLELWEIPGPVRYGMVMDCAVFFSD